MISKLLANRLIFVLTNVIDVKNILFSEHRILLYSVVVTNETIEDGKWSQNQGVIIKVDFEKVYDKCDSLNYMMLSLRFSNTRIS